MKKITVILCLLTALVLQAQFSGAGFYRVHNVYSDAYITIRGTHFERLTDPRAFWPCILMQTDSAQSVDPGSIIYIPEMGKTSLCAQGVSTYSLTGLMLEVDTASVRENGLDTYIAKTQYQNFPCIFRDYGNGLTAGTKEKSESRWWIEPVNETTMDFSYLGVKPADETVVDEEGWYWTTMCCDFPFFLPVDGGVEGAYTVNAVTSDSLGYYAAAVKVYGQGDTVPAATPVLLKCKASYASGNKVVPVGQIANRTNLPIASDMLQGNYFAPFENHCHLTDYTVMATYTPDQSILSSPTRLALGVDAEGRLGFFPQEEGTYMAANTAWLNVEGLEDGNVTAVYLVTAVDTQEPEEPQEPEAIIGDANGDGKLTIKDVTLILDYLCRDDVEVDYSKSTINIMNSDVNGDGVITIKDVTALLEILMNMA